jgi:FYVE zinc finger/WW domain
MPAAATTVNPAALAGWVKSKDPKSGRVFYANHITRKTQWDPPGDWVETAETNTSGTTGAAPSYAASSSRSSGSGGSMSAAAANAVGDENDELPGNWEVMHDPTTGKPFYVDHERKITTWTRPRAEAASSSSSSFADSLLRPAVASSPSSGNSPGVTRTRHAVSSSDATATTKSSPFASSYQQELGSHYQAHQHFSSSSSSYSHHKYEQPYTSSFSDALPALDFQVVKVADSERLSCAQSGQVFTMRLRRHHCRLCGDVFCDECSSHRVLLPLDGVEFEKPVRVCDLCNVDVAAGNFFSLRRYLTPLALYKNNSSTDADKDSNESLAATPSHVNAALYALTQDLDQMVTSGEGNLREKMTLPPSVLMPALQRALHSRETCDRAIVCIAAILAWEGIVDTSGSGTSSPTKEKEKGTYASTLFQETETLDTILKLLERSGSDRKTLYVQEQAARTLFYLTEPKTIAAVLEQQQRQEQRGAGDENKNNIDAESIEEGVNALDLPRCIRNTLDHASNEKNQSLQRWSAACLKQLVLEDQRRACAAMNDVAAAIATGDNNSNAALSYESFLPELINTGGILILCSLIGANDSDTRAHAVGALGAVLNATRAIHSSLATLAEMTGQPSFTAASSESSSSTVSAIVAAGGCGATVSQLLISADHGVAGMGCQFLASLVLPILSSSPGGGGGGGDSGGNDNDDPTDPNSDMAPCREAAMEIATGSCLPALLSLVRAGNNKLPMELQQLATETLAAVVFAVGQMGKAYSRGSYEEGLAHSRAPSKCMQALGLLNEEGVVECALQVLISTGGQSLASVRSGGKVIETPSSRIREAAGIMLGSLTSCSAEAIMALQTSSTATTASNNILSSLLVSSNDANMTVPSTLRGDAAPRCCGVLDTVASILMFAWQHPSGASSELLDRLIEVLDAGALPFLSRILNMKVDWDSLTAIGAMKAKTAASRLLCCIFGIALTDESSIGMRRLMDAVDSDARAYATSNSSSNGGGRKSGSSTSSQQPRNIMEAALTVLQASSTRARSAIMGGATSNAIRSPSYQTALMDLVDASLLATGSMCGSSVAPGGSEGTMVTADKFLADNKKHAASMNQVFESRKNAVCSFACDVVVRASRSGQPLLPAMLVGGYGEASVLSSLRLALAIAQNGTKDQHAKLALSGILVPISDSLRTALSSGDLYKFSAALALVRFCGPHVAAGQGGGIESVRDAIRVATNVLTLPVNPDATIEQIETQESLKSECIAALEALSRNASLWSSISSDALPSMVRFLQMTAAIGPKDPRRQKTRCAALRAVLQIVQVPSHAESAAEGGIADALGALLKNGDFLTDDDEVPMLALEVLSVIASNPQARRKALFLDTGMVRSICAALGKSATETPNKPSDSRADVTFLGLEILNAILSDIHDKSRTVDQVLQSADAIAFLDAVATEAQFVRALCSTLLLKTNMKLQRHDVDVAPGQETYFDIPKHLYGPPLILVQEACAGYVDTHHAAAALLFTVSLYACAIDSNISDSYWKTFLLQDLPSAGGDENEGLRVAATIAAHFLSCLTDYKPFVPSDPFRKQEYMTITRPLVRHRLLEALKDSIEDLSSGESRDPYVISLLVSFNVPHVCLSLWKDPALLDLAFDLIKNVVEQDPEEVLHLFVDGEAAIMSLFDLLNIDDSKIETSKNINEIRRFLASILGKLAETGLLTQAIEKFDVRSGAIGALAAACLSEEERSENEGQADEDEDITSNRLSSVLMKCLVELCTVNEFGKKCIRLSPAEAQAIASNLGKKLCQMVLSRFLERAKLKQYEMEEDEEDDNIMEAPDLAMLCALAQHAEALQTLRSIGGLHALSLIAAEGELSAIVALQKACASDASVLLESDAYQGILKLLAVGDESDESSSWRANQTVKRQVEGAAFELLARLCTDSVKGRNAVAESEHCQDCTTRAIEIVSVLAGAKNELDEKDQDDESAYANSEDEAHSAMDSGALPPPPSYDETVGSEDAEKGERELGVAACLLLSALAPTSAARKTLVDDVNFVNALSHLAADNASAELRYAGLNLVSALLPYVAGDKDSTDRLSEVLLSGLTSEHKLAATVDLNANKIRKTSVTGLVVVFDYLSDEQQNMAGKAIAAHFSKTVKACTITRSTARQAQRAHAADLAYNLTIALILVRGKDFMDDVFTQDIMTSFFHLVQWRQDPKTTVDKAEEKPWDAAIGNCLLLLSLLVWRPDELLTKAKIDLKALAETSLMLARPGKAPRKAIDLKSALLRIADGTDASASLSASRIMDRLF